MTAPLSESFRVKALALLDCCGTDSGGPGHPIRNAIIRACYRPDKLDELAYVIRDGDLSRSAESGRFRRLGHTGRQRGSLAGKHQRAHRAIHCEKCWDMYRPIHNELLDLRASHGG